MELKKILCAVDLKDSVNPAVEYAKMLSELSGASISAIYVVSSRSAYENLQVPVEDIAKGMKHLVPCPGGYGCFRGEAVPRHGRQRAHL